MRIGASAASDDDTLGTRHSAFYELQRIFSFLMESDSQYFAPVGFWKEFKFYGQKVQLEFAVKTCSWLFVCMSLCAVVCMWVTGFVKRGILCRILIAQCPFNFIMPRMYIQE